MEGKVDIKESMNSITLESKREDLKNKERELEDIDYAIKANSEEADRIARDIELFKKISAIVIENLGKINPEFKFEEIIEYQVLMKDKQKIDNERVIAQWSDKLRQANTFISKAKDNRVHLIAAIDLNKQMIKDLEGEMK